MGAVANCATSVTLGCVFCCEGCNAEKLRNAYAFLPPRPSYTVEEGVDGEQVGRLRFRTDALGGSEFYRNAASHSSVHFVETAFGERVPVVWVWPPSASSSRWCAAANGEALSPRRAKSRPLTLLHCHGNATDIGLMLGMYFELARRLDCEVVGVEYTGYGAATGSPSPARAIADAEAAYELLVGVGVPPERIIAYGQSVGSGPALHLAARRRLGGVVLHSPMLSGIKVVDPRPNACCRPSCVYRCFDFFKNYRVVRSAACPVFVVHGLADDIVPPHHGQRLAASAPGCFRWPGFFPAGAGHNDVVEKGSTAYFGVLLAFLRHVREAAEATAASGPIVGLVGKPEQQEMAERWNGTIAWQSDGVDGAAPPSPDGAVVLVGPAGNHAEPMVGPGDGRYAQLRSGGGGAQQMLTRPSGDARTLSDAGVHRSQS